MLEELKGIYLQNEVREVTLEEQIAKFAKENNQSIAFVKQLIAKNLDTLTVPNAIVYNRETNEYLFVKEYTDLKEGNIKT